ncbi:MAG: hypothetical protein F6K04_20645, partial [Leptolyngbya sp. SIO4C5]|nr:hypothetical protein [Leptolyngbya sp. SIO4C5]
NIVSSFNAKKTLSVEGKDYQIYSLPEAAKTLGDVSRLPIAALTIIHPIALA